MDTIAVEPVHASPRRRIGIIGRPTLSEQEARKLYHIGRCIARLGHSLVLVPARGTVHQVEEGYQVEGGTAIRLDEGVIPSSDDTLIYADERLLARLRTKYPDLDTNPHTFVIREDELGLWTEAVDKLLTERDIPIPVTPTGER